jgi:tripartite motif-containing protein 71
MTRTQARTHFCLVLLSAVPAWAAEAARFSGLGDLPGGPYLSCPLAISSDGSVVVGYSMSTKGTRAVRWQNGAITDLGMLPGGDVSGIAHGLSSQGLVVVGQAEAVSGSVAFLWENASSKPLDGLVAKKASGAWGVSADGSVVVGQMTSDSGTEAFRWTAGNLMALGDLPGGRFQSIAYGVSADGAVIVGTGQSASGDEACVWKNGETISLGHLPGGPSSQATAVNANGTVVVGRSESIWGVEAFRWQNGSMLGLGGLSAHNDLMSYASGVSADGSIIVGTSEDDTDTLAAFIWDADRGMRSLQEVLASDLGVDLTGWKLSEASGVSGSGINPHGDNEGWIAHLDAVTTRPAESPLCRITLETSAAKETPPPCRFAKFEREVGSLPEPTGVAIDGDGSIYVADPVAGEVRVFNAGGNPVRQWKPHGLTPPSESRPSGISLREGNVYLTDTVNHRIIVCDRSGRYLRGWGEPGNGRGQFHLPQGIHVDAKRIYVADTGNHRIQVFDLQGYFLNVFGVYGHGRGEFNRPSDVVAAEDGSIFVVDSDNHRIQKFDAEGRFLLEWGQWGGARGMLKYPTGIAFHSGAVYVADTVNHRIEVFDEQGNVRYAWGLPVIVPRKSGGRLHYPGSIAISPAGDLAVVGEPCEDRVQIFKGVRNEITPDGDRAGFTRPPVPAYFGMYLAAGNNLLVVPQPDDHTIQFIDLHSPAPIATNPLGGYGVEFGQLSDPAGVSINPQKPELWINDRGNHRLALYQIELDPSEAARQSPNRSRLVKSYSYHVLTSFVPALEGHGEIAPEAIKCDNGRLYVVDRNHSTVFVFGADMKFLHALGGHGTKQGQLRTPTDVAVNRSSQIAYVVDSGNQRIQAFSSQGQFLFGWGQHGTGTGEFMYPFGIATGNDGSVYVTDSALHRIQQFDERGHFTRRWGRQGMGPAEMFKPTGIVQDDQQRLCVMDYGNHRIQIFSPVGECLAVLGGGIYSKPAGTRMRPLSVIQVQSPIASRQPTIPADQPKTMPSGERRKHTGPQLHAVSNDRTFAVTCTPKPAIIPLSEPFDLDVRILTNDDLASPISDVSLRVDARMPAHGHGMNTLPEVTKTGNGRFNVTGLLFHMPGHWELYLDVTRDSVTQRVQLDVDLE